MGSAESRTPFSSLSPANAAPAASDEESYLEQPIELDAFEDGGNDDEEASDLVVGEGIDVLGEAEGDNDPIELDLGTLVRFDDARGPLDDDNDSGFEVDPAIGLALPEALLPDDGSEGLDDGAITVDESKFPALELDDGSEGVAAEREISLGSANDEAPIPLAACPWQLVRPMASLEACHVLVTTQDQVAFGSSDLLWFQSDTHIPLRVAVDGTTLADVALLGAEQDIALASTQSGQLFRRARFASQAEQLTRFRETLRLAPGSRTQISFGGCLSTRGGRTLLWTRDGTLLDVLDSGDRFEQVALDGKVLAVARESATALVARGTAHFLVQLDGMAERRLSLAPQRFAQGSTPLLATAHGSVALAARGQALLVSADGGTAFRHVAGSGSISSLAGAELAEGPRFFAALYRETSDQSEILLVDPERAEAEIIARLDVAHDHSPSDAIDRGEWAKVSSLSWHAPSGCLWAAGGFGVVRFKKP